MQKEHQRKRWTISSPFWGKHVKVATHYLVMVLITCCAILMMLAVSGSWWGDKDKKKPINKEQSDAIFNLAAVTTSDLRPDWHLITEPYTGMLHPKEIYTISFQIGGRLKSLGISKDGDYLDVGDEVRIDAELGKLDDDLLQTQLIKASANLDKAKANLVKANEDLKRLERLRRKNQQSIITEAEYKEAVAVEKANQAEVKVAQSELKIAQKNLSDATIRFTDDRPQFTPKKNSLNQTLPSPNRRPNAQRRFVIKERFVQVGESISPHQPVMEIIEVDRVLLKIGVPESEVQQIIRYQREKNRQRGNAQLRTPSSNDAERNIKTSTNADVIVEVRSKDYAKKNSPMPGMIYRIAQSANDTTGQFTVEIEIDNPDGMLRPGFVANVKIVVGHVYGFKVPSSILIFKNNHASMFTIDSTLAKSETNKKEPQKPDGIARKIEIPRYIDRGSTIIIPLNDAPKELRSLTQAVFQGQHRLTDGIPVRIVQTQQTPKENQLEQRIEYPSMKQHQKPLH